jgi:hypothetical protein
LDFLIKNAVLISVVAACVAILGTFTEIGKKICLCVKKRKVYKSNKWKAVEYNKEGEFLAYEGPFDELTEGKDTGYNKEKMVPVLEKAGLRLYLENINDTSRCENKKYQQVFLTNKKTWYKQITSKKELTLMAKEKEIN